MSNASSIDWALYLGPVVVTQLEVRLRFFARELSFIN